MLPLIVDPMFNHFEPLAQTHPSWCSNWNEWSRRPGFHSACTHVPDEGQRKVHQLECLRDGIRLLARVVVWDTTLKSSPTDEILLVFGHELGHYVLHHIERGLAMGAVVSLFFYGSAPTLWFG